MLNPEGWVTRAIGAIRREAHWTTYYKLIERANVSVTELSLRLLQLVLRVCPAELVTLILDDTLVPRCVKFGPGISIKHDHSHKANRPTFLNSQCWVTLALVVRVRLGSALTVPIRSWLLEESGQRGKLWVARQLMDSIRGQVKGVRLLIDAWFMRSSLILPLLEQQVRIIGQVRRDTALFLPPEPEPKRRGRKRNYGRRIDPAVLEALPVQESNCVRRQAFSGAFVMLWVPRATRFDYGIQDREDFVHASDQRNFFGLSLGDQALMKRLDHGVVTDGTQGGHV
jgi:hypothetical protein